MQTQGHLSISRKTAVLMFSKVHGCTSLPVTLEVFQMLKLTLENLLKMYQLCYRFVWELEHHICMMRSEPSVCAKGEKCQMLPAVPALYQSPSSPQPGRPRCPQSPHPQLRFLCISAPRNQHASKKHTPDFCPSSVLISQVQVMR